MALIPRLPDHLACQLLARCPFEKLHEAKEVSRRWKVEIERPLFQRLRRALGITQPVTVIIQRWTDSAYRPFYPRNHSNDIFRIAFFNENLGCWSYLPPLPDYPVSMPHDCTVVGVGSELVVLGGSEPTDDENNIKSVYIFNFISSKWRRGVDMPNQEQIMKFGCCSDFENKVYVVGGTDDYHNPSRLVMVYNVAHDEWSRLPDMARAREGCQMAFREGKLIILNEMLSFNATEIKVFDVSKGSWDSCVIEKGVPRGIYAEGKEKGMYKCDRYSRKVYVKKGGMWQVLTDLPKKVDCVYFSVAWGNKLMVFCSFEDDEELQCFTIDLKTLEWRKDSMPEGFTENITSGCCLEV